jgi:hypothetical protein
MFKTQNKTQNKTTKIIGKKQIDYEGQKVWVSICPTRKCHGLVSSQNTHTFYRT